MPTTLVISPHLDDAVLSLGGSIAAWRAAGERVVIASVYTTGPAVSDVVPHMRAFADYDARRVEDVAACGVLGAEPRWLDRVERAFRPPFLTDFDFFRTPPERAGFTTLAAVTAALARLGDLDPARIAVPIGIGNHIDHVETLVAALDWAHAGGLLDRVVFYEDFYALAAALRARHPIVRRRVWCHGDSPLAGSPRLAAVMQRIANNGSGPDVTSYFPPPLRDADWTVAHSNIRATERTKLAAIACYRSQTRAFGGLLGIVRATRAYHSWWRGAEPLWRAA